jgi:hypothetical protein
VPRKSAKIDVPGCEFHTAKDDKGNSIRTGACNGYCRVYADLQGKLPLTEFLKKLLAYSDEDLTKADAGKAAKVYGINREHAAGYIRMCQVQRGINAQDMGGLLGSGKPQKRKRGKVAATGGK